MKVIEHSLPVPWKIGSFITQTGWTYKSKFCGVIPCYQRRGWVGTDFKPCRGCPTGGIAIVTRRLRKRLGPVRYECAGWNGMLKWRDWTAEDETRWVEKVNR